ANLDKLAGGDYTAVSKTQQDKYLAKPAASDFLSLLFEHTIEGLYANPEYGGNRGQQGWKDIGYPGDSQPLGYTADEVTRSDGPDPVGKTAIVAGAGAGGSIAAMELAQAGWDVVVFEKGPNYFTNLAGPGPFGTLFANDDLKMNVRYFGGPDPLTCPRTWRPDASTPVQYTG